MNQFRRLLWFFAIFLTPLSGVFYIWAHGLRNGNQETLHILILILGISFAVTLVCAHFQPVRLIEDVQLLRSGRINLCLAVLDVAIFAVLAFGRLSFRDACQTTAECDQLPLIWLALAGMHSCYAVWAYATRLKSLR